MKKLLIFTLIVLAACASDSATATDVKSPTADRVIHTSDDPGELEDIEFDKITIDGMPCIIWKDGRRLNGDSAFAYSGLTCNWDYAKDQPVPK